MVSGKVVVKRKRNWMKIMIIAAVVLVLIGGLWALNVFVLRNLGYDLLGFLEKKGEKVIIVNPMQKIIDAGGSEEEVVENAVVDFDEEYIDYVLFAMGVWKLHNPPLSDDVPRIEFQINETYNSEIIDGSPVTSEGEIDDEDIIISTTKEEVVRAILSEDVEEFMEESVQEGETEIEMKAEKITLFGKGYLVMYQDITGEELSELFE